MGYYKKIALIGAIANPNIGDEAILESNLQLIQKMYDSNCKIYVFTKDASYTSVNNLDIRNQVIPVDYIHRISLNCKYDINEIEKEICNLLSYERKVTCHPDINYLYEAIIRIFEEIDILHIIGGGYINSLWTDMMYEVYLATKLALKYNKKYILTGSSITPVKKENLVVINEIVSNAFLADFRDHSATGLEKTQNIYVTVDDAVNMTDIYPVAETEKYANILLHVWNGNENIVRDKIKEVFLPFIKRCLDEKIVSKFKILGFSQCDLDIWDDINNYIEQDLQSKIEYIDFVNKSCIWAKHLVAGAVFNVASRYHMAVFSLSVSKPIYSIIYDDYYENKIESIHKLYCSKCYISLKHVTKQSLYEFVKNQSEVTANLLTQQSKVQKIYDKKCQLIATAYGINTTDAEILYHKMTGLDIRPKISIIIPIFNMDAYLRDCLNSVLNQSLQELEIICINDGSTDYSQMILNEYSWKDNRIKIISQSNHGVAFARNQGIESAKGEYLFFLDPDDWLPDNNILSDMYTAAIQNHALICGGNFTEYNCGMEINQWTGNLCKYNFQKKGFINYADYQFDYGWVRFIYNRDFIFYHNFRIPSYKFFEDPVFFVKVMHAAEKFYAINKCTYCYRTGHKNMVLSYEKVVDLLKGLRDNIIFAVENGYDNLKALEMARIEEDFAEPLLKYLMNSSSVELREIFQEINNVLYDDNNRIEFRIYNKMIGTKERNIYDLKNSTTWKVGDKVMKLPKILKTRALRRTK